MVPGAALAATRRGTPLASSVDAAVIAEGCIRLAAAEPVFAGLLERHGQPPLWQRPATLGSLVQIILEQKVSLESARAVFDRVALLCPGLTPEALLAASPEALLEAGVSRRKISYCRSIAEALVSGDLQLEELAQLDSAAAEQRLIAIRGIGPWTAGVYTMMVLCRPDAWASGDRALAVSAQECFALDAVPGYPELDVMATAWKPWRGSAARLLWHAYLHRRQRAG